jgi:hypothetical protein
LSDAKLRERYDRIGKDAVADAGLASIDATLFFSMLFGSEQFEKYIGKLVLARKMDHFVRGIQKEFERRQADGSAAPARDILWDRMLQDMYDPTETKFGKKLKRQQHAREVRCAVHLCERLERWVHGRDEAGFMAAASQEASELVRASFGGRLLRTMGQIYENCAEQWLANTYGIFTVEGQLASLKGSSHSVHVRVAAASSVVNSLWAVKKMHDAHEQDSEDDEEHKEEKKDEAGKHLDESFPVILQTIWDFSSIDIEGTVRRVCNKLLKDSSVPWQIRFRRAVALRRLGRIFRDVGQVEHGDVSKPQVAKQHLEEALHNALREKVQL